MLTRAAVLLASTLAFTACSGNGGGAGKSPAPSPTTFANLKSGTATITVSGGGSASVTLPLKPSESQLNPAPGGFALFFGSGTESYTVGGVTFSGKRSTSGTLVIGFVVKVEGKTLAITSRDGFCVLELTVEGRTAAGAMDCPKIEANGLQYVVKGTFDVR